MPSHPASRVPGVLLIPRSCRCLSPFPLTPSPYLSCKGKERKCRENGRGGLSKAPLSHRRLAVRSEKFPHAIDLRAQITQVWWGMYCWRWEDRGGLVPSSEPSPSSVIEYFIEAPRPAPDIPKSPSASVTPFWWRRLEIWSLLIWFHRRRRDLAKIYLAFANFRKVTQPRCLIGSYVIQNASWHKKHSGWTLLRINQTVEPHNQMY